MKEIAGYKRTQSLISKSELEDLYTLYKFPIHMLSDDEDLCSDMIFSIGKKDGFIELHRTIPPEILYKDTHSNAIGAMWKGAHEKVAELISRYSKDCKILEIGGGTGRLNSEFNIMGGTCAEWIIVEPQPCPVEGCTARFIRGFFPDAVENEKYDIIVHTHCIEHMEDINAFLHNVGVRIKRQGKMLFSVPDMKPMFENNMTSIINFEHTLMITEEYLDYLLLINGFCIEEKASYGNGHSLIYATTYTGGGGV